MTDTRLAEATQILAGEDGSLRGAERYDGMTRRCTGSRPFWS